MANLTAQSETTFSSTDKKRKKITLNFVRFGKKGGKNSRELFRINMQSGSMTGETLYMTLEDLKRIVIDAETLIKVADDEI